MPEFELLPQRLSAIMSAIESAPGPVQVVVPDAGGAESVIAVAQACGVPLSDARGAHRERAVHEVSSGLSRGYVTTSEWSFPDAGTVLTLGDVLPGRDRAREARIGALLHERWRAGVDLPALGAWPSGSRLPSASRLLPGKALADRRDIGLGEDVAACVDGRDGSFPLALRTPCADFFSAWQQVRGRTRVEAVVTAPHPSHPVMTAHLAVGIAAILSARYAGELAGNVPPPGAEEPGERVRRLAGQLRLNPALVDVSQVAGRHVLLVGLSWTEGWTMTVSGQLLLSAGARSVRPFTLSSDSRRARRR
ncbi:hypothetical protein [Flaviflexus equikiangi]|uniref:Uncharacterized protein n=1 Tax=Flaviflexus equikiangi TaxID=2758573 RepID=A0ABS2THJ2_9ACTO|nr:hypothetical protein [Flaviflexus equikiangi]MBM9432749.1 hypothetical protein [Flaviflexus equikiangi]